MRYAAILMLWVAAAGARGAVDVRAELMTDMAAVSARGGTLLPQDYLRKAMEEWPGAGDLRAAAGDPAALAALPDAKRRAAEAAAAERLVRAVERRFVHDPAASTLDLLPASERARYRDFAWQENDYPGGPTGANEGRAVEMDAALCQVRPERRANSNASAVVTEAEYNDAVWEYIRSRRAPVPGQAPRKLDKDAVPSFRAMAADAKRDGVDLVIISSDRDPTVAARNAAREANAYAVARFSSHILGLAMDLQMSGDGLSFEEATTRPMSNVIGMRRSPAHKWMFLHGAAYGWYPYMHEPWHWEYNPPGFRERFWKGYRPGAKGS
ncbi:MAG TPA: D-alanyl-D-alanine carboxypeptidase family protein [Armatimonadota bacterium]